nr:phage tail protein [Myxococcus sp. MH1]
MTPSPRDRLYKLLPAIHRAKDTLQGEPLRALLAIMEHELLALEEDIGQLHDNWFIETCQEWVVPYIGDLLKVRDLVPVDPGLFSQRAYVANTLAYRRRKGTAAMLEQLARDVTGWPARAVEFFQRVGTTQYLNHPRLTSLRTPDLRDANALELVGTPFENATRTVDVRHIDNQRGQHNLPNVGLFLWRLESYPVVLAPAYRVLPASEPGATEEGLFRFDALGCDTHLFNLPQSETTLSSLAGEPNVPTPLRRRPLYDELEARRAALARGQTPEQRYFGATPPFTLHLDAGPGAFEAISPDEVLICDLSTWHRPPATLPYPPLDPSLPPVNRSIRVAVDPVNGRLAFAEGLPVPTALSVSYAYGFSSEVGGGFYDRQETLLPLEQRGAWRVDTRVGPYTTLASALSASSASGDALVEVLDSERYPLATLDVAVGSRLELRAANLQRPVIDLQGGRGLIRLGEGATLVLSGLLVRGGVLEVQAADNATLDLRHCTLVPGQDLLPDGQPRTTEPSLVVKGEKDGDCTVLLHRCITGPVRTGRATVLRLEDCIVDGLGGPALQGLPTPPGPLLPEEEDLEAEGLTGTLHVLASTVLGTVETTVLELASDSLFTGRVNVVQRQKGCMRFCYVPPGSHVPQRFRCQPAYAEGTPEDVRLELERRVKPVFTSDRYLEPGYCQLRDDTDSGIRRGASDEGEMGVFHHLQQPQREANLRASLTDYLRFGLEAGFFFVT